MAHTFLSHLQLWNYRNFKALSLKTEGEPVVITGKNGAGKTNILEAISLLAPGLGLRQANKQALPHQGPTATTENWSITADITTPKGHFAIHTHPSEDLKKRCILINDNIQKNQSSLGDILSILWITPRFDHFFLDTTDTRRRFLDRMIASFYPAHTHYCTYYEKACKTRMKLLKDYQHKLQAADIWLAGIEKQIAEYGMVITTTRLEFIEKLNQLPAHPPFPKAILFLNDPLNERLLNTPAVDIEIEWQHNLRSQRPYDLKTNTTSFGPHKSDFQATHAELCMEAKSCSTGEQKMLLLSLLLSCATLHAVHHKRPLFLLDEVTSHLDQDKINAFLRALIQLKNQFWITGVDPTHYQEIKDDALFMIAKENTIFTT